MIVGDDRSQFYAAAAVTGLIAGATVGGGVAVALLVIVPVHWVHAALDFVILLVVIFAAIGSATGVVFLQDWYRRQTGPS